MRVFSTIHKVHKLGLVVLVYLMLGLILPVALNLALPLAAHAAATVITVNSPDDEDNPTDGDGHKCTLRKAINDAAANTGDTFLYPKDCNLTAVTPGPPYAIVFSGVTSVTLTNNAAANTGQIFINQPLTISGPVSISGGDVTNIFVVNSDLNLINVNLQHGKFPNNNSGSGGAIKMTSSTLTVTNATFDSNTASTDGGAIEFDGTALILTNTIFTNNQANGGNGGAIHLTGGGATFAFITNALFVSNTANDNGGAIFTGVDNTGTFGNYSFAGTLITNSVFSNNTANAANSTAGGTTEGGGAIYNDNNGFLGIVSGSFGLPGGSTGNNVKGTASRGGAIYNASGAQLYVNQGYFNNNTVSSDTSGYGGAIYNRNNMLITGTYFDNNTSSGSGGAVANDATTSSTANIVNTTFNGNNAVVSGGAVYTFYSSGGSSSNLNLYNDTIDSNKAPKGGGIFNDIVMQGSGGVTLGNTIVTSNTGGNCALGSFNGTNANALTDSGHNIEFPNATAQANTCFGNISNNDQFGDPKLKSPFLNFPDSAVLPAPPTPPLTIFAWTEALQAGSSALFNGDNNICGMVFPPAVTTNLSGADARNSKRPNPANTNCDIGAYESSIDLTTHPTLSEGFVPAVINTAGSSALNFNLTNPYNQSFTNVSFTATVDANVTLGAITNGCDTNGTVAINGQQINISNLNLAANQQCTISVAVVGPINGTYHSQISNISTTESGNTSINLDITLTVQPGTNPAPPAISQVFNPSPILINGNSTLTLVLTNPNNAQQLDNIAFTANLDPAITVNVAGTVKTCGNNNNSLTVNYSNNQLNVSKMTLTSNQQCTIKIPVVGTKVGALPSEIGSISSSEAQLTGLNLITSLVVQPLPPNTIKATGGTPQSTTVGTAFSTNLQATVLDSNNVPVQGVTVTFVAPANGASGTFQNGNTSKTDVNGNASVAFTANNTSGTYNVTANVNPALNPPAAFVLTNTVVPPATPAFIKATGGTPQSSQINNTFANKLQATVLDAGNNPVKGVNVVFSAPASGASGSFIGGNSALTDVNGNASVTFMANSTAGTYNVTANVNPALNPGATFVLTNTPGPAASITLSGGSSQSTQVNTAFPNPLKVLVTDSGGNTLQGITVTFTGPNSGASTNPAINTAVTDASGIASLNVTANNTAGGPYNVVASIANVNSSVVFNLTNTAGPPPMAAKIVASGGSPQSTTVNTNFASLLKATVTDNSNLPVANVTVTFTAPGAGASGTFPNGNTSVTDVNGVASVVFKANTITGSYNVTANTNPALNPAANFSLTNTAGTATSITVTGGDAQSTLINTAFTQPLQAVVKDGFGNAVSGVSVIYTAPVNGASATFTGNVNQISDVNGAVSLGVVANNTVGTYQVTAKAVGVANPANFGLTNTSVPNPTLTITTVAGSLQSATVNTAFATTLQAKVTDSSNVAKSGVQVTFTAPSNGASGSFMGGGLSYTITTDANGLATATVFTANNIAGNYDVVATGVGVSNSTAFHLTNTAVVIPQQTYTYYLPFLSNSFNGFTTFLSFENYGNNTANLSFQFYDATGLLVINPNGICNTLAQYGQCTVPNPFASGSKGTGVITSNQPLSVLVAETTPYGGSSYAVPTGTSSQLTAPLAINNFYGGFVTRLTIGNFGTTSSNITINFYKDDGTLQSAATRTINVATHTSVTIDQSSADSNLPSGFNGWAQIIGDSGSQLVAQVLEQNPNNHFVALVNAQTTVQTTLFAPAIFNNAFGGYVTGSNIVNPNATVVNVTVTYYRNDGTSIGTTPFSLPAHAIAGIFQARTDNINGLPNGGLPLGFYGAAKVSTTGGGVVMMVNEAAGTLANGGARSGTYSAAPGGSSQLGLPVVANNGAGFTSGVTILNTADVTVSGTIQYFNPDGTPQGSPQPFNVGSNSGNPAVGLAAHSSLPLYQGSHTNLPSGFIGSAVIIETSGPANSLATTVNMQSDTIFYTYALPGE